MNWLVKPVNIITGAVAPAISCDSEKRDDAISEAISKSNLSRYDRWHFNMEVKRLKVKQVKRKVYEEEN